jgi:hypothetical protein
MSDVHALSEVEPVDLVNQADAEADAGVNVVADQTEQSHLERT